MTTTNQPTNTLPDANIAPTDPPTPTETDKERRKRLSAEKKALEIEALRAEMRAEVEAEMRAELAKKDAEIADLKKKPVRKAREPKPPTYWEGQVETAEGWRFESKETAKLYGKSLKGEEKDDFMMEWDEPFAEKKEKTAGKRGRVGEIKNADEPERCESTTCRNGEIVRCKSKFSALRGGRRICTRHNKDADNHFAKYENWKIEYGTHGGWYDEKETIGRDTHKGPDGKKLHPVRKDWVKPPRGKKD